MTVSLLAACDSPRLLNTSLFPFQRRLLDALDRGPEQVHIWKLGRRSGKTRAAATAMTCNACLRPDLDGLVEPGEARLIVSVANKAEQARICIEQVRRIVHGSPLAAMVEAEGPYEIRFRTEQGTVSIVRAETTSARSSRGLPISMLLLDEFGHFEQVDGNASDRPTWDALAPALAQFQEHGRIVVASTPAGVGGMFASMYEAGAAGERPYRTFSAASWEANPTLSEDALRDGSIDEYFFRSEYGAELFGGVAAWFDVEKYRRSGVVEVAPQDGTKWLMAVDVAVQRDPFAAVVVGRSKTDPKRMVIGSANAWLPDGTSSFEEEDAERDSLLRRAFELGRRYGVRRVIVDQFAAKRVEQKFAEAGFAPVSRPWTTKTRLESMVQLREALQLGELELPDVPELTRELQQVQVKHAGSDSRILTPRTSEGHCDRALALAAAVYDLRYASLGVRKAWSGGGPLLTAGMTPGSF